MTVNDLGERSTAADSRSVSRAGFLTVPTEEGVIFLIFMKFYWNPKLSSIREQQGSYVGTSAFYLTCWFNRPYVACAAQPTAALDLFTLKCDTPAQSLFFHKHVA